MRLDRGLYKYDPLQGDRSFEGKVRSGKWKFENMRFDKTCHHATTYPLVTSNQKDRQTSHTSKDGYPITLPTGQKLQWINYTNGSETIWISANGAPPLNPDAVLTVITLLERDGMNPDEWICSSTEYNIDNIEFSIPGEYTVQTCKNIYYKIYQHDNTARVEVADRSKVHAKDVIEVLTTLAASADRVNASRRIDEVERHLQVTDKTARAAYQLASNSIRTAAELKKEMKCT